MAKRFTDSVKWNKPFLRSLQAPYKLLWLYILDECDHAGVWQLDLQVAQIKIGEKLNLKTALNSFEGKIIEIDSGQKWFILDFIEFQYGTLNPQNRAHASVINVLNKYYLLDSDLNIKPLTSPLQGRKDKDKDKDKDMEMVKVKELVFPFDSENFKKLWDLILEGKKWKNKSINSLQMALKKLSLESEPDACKMLENAIQGEWQGLVELKPHEKINGKQSTNQNSRHAPAFAVGNAALKRLADIESRNNATGGNDTGT